MYFKPPITKIGIIKTPLNQFHRLAFNCSKWTLWIQILNEEVFGVCCLLFLLYNEGALKKDDKWGFEEREEHSIY